MSKQGFSTLLSPDEAQEPILAKAVRASLLEWLTEIWAEEELRAVGLTARRRGLLTGAPGTGKTTLAHHLAARLGLPLAVIRPDDIHGRYVGSNTTNVKKVFDLAESMAENGQPPVLLFDEFETVAQKRMSSGVNELGEYDHNAMVNTLLTRLDDYRGFIIAATNHAPNIDAAVWRRFDIQIELALPSQPERERILARYLAPFGLPKPALRHLGEAFETASPALMRQFAEGLKRQIVVGPKAGWDMAKDAVVGRLLASVAPHPEAGKPRLWAHLTSDAAVRAMPWPLPRLDAMSAEITDAQPDDDLAEIVTLSERRGRA